MTFQVVSFSSFMFSSLVAQGLKQVIVIINRNIVKMIFKAQINNTFLRVGMLLSALGSICGSIFQMLALMDLIQIKLRTLSYGISQSIGVVETLFMLVSIALAKIPLKTSLAIFSHCPHQHRYATKMFPIFFHWTIGMFYL